MEAVGPEFGANMTSVSAREKYFRIVTIRIRVNFNAPTRIFCI